VNSTRLAFRIHSWIGLITGAALLVIALTGAYLVFDTELDRLFNPQIRDRPPAPHPVSIDAVLQAVRSRYPHNHIGLVTFPADETSPFVASLRRIDEDGTYVRDQVYVDARTGRIIGHRVSGHYLTSWILRLHEGLWLPEKWGQPLVAVLGAIMAISGLTGLWVYRKRIGEALRFKDSTRRLGRTHAHLGVWACLFSILLGTTGMVLNWSSLLVVCRAAPVPEMGAEWTLLDRIPPLESMLTESRRAFPDLELHAVYFPNHPGDPVKIGGYVPGGEILGKSSFVAFRPSRPLKVISIYDARRASPALKLLYMTNSLHYGDFGGAASKSLYVAAGLVLTFLAGSGLWIALKPRRR
jgi:uncharacterized iron-regulated membrane protein